MSQQGAANRGRLAWTELVGGVRDSLAPPRRPGESTRRWLRRGARDGERRFRRWATAAPASLIYLFTLAVTTWTLSGVDPQVARRLLISQSTNLDNMVHEPFRVLVASAFWVEGASSYGLVALAFLVVMIPAERWLGTRRWIAAFAGGHVGATLVTVTGIAVGLSRGWLGRGVARASDVGVSYGFVAVAGLLSYRFRDRRVRATWVAAFLVGLGVMVGLRGTFTDYGHLAAFCLGLAMRRLARPRTADAGVAQQVDPRPPGARPADTG